MPSDRQTLHDLLSTVRLQIQAAAADAKPITDLTQLLELRRQVAELERALTAAVSLHAVPIELCHAMRAPEGTIQTADVNVSGHPVRVIVHPLGRADAQRETVAWADITATVAGRLADGRQLRPMDQAIAALEVTTSTLSALVVNTEQSRQAARMAIDALRHGTLLPLPVAVAWDRLRRSPRRTITAITAVLPITVATALVFGAYVGSPPDSPLTQMRPEPALAETEPAAPTAPPPSARPTGDGSAASPPSRSAPSDSGKPPSSDPPGRHSAPPPSSDPTARPSRPASPRPRDKDDSAAWPSDPRLSQNPATGDPGPGASRPPRSATVAPPAAATDPPSKPAPTPPKPEPTSPPPAQPSPAKTCHLAQVDVDLPILGADICL
ncbi:hypothetical protein ACFOWE_31220 [Planomonospora corallina]|uniref:Uncharacterized protein n=1 Tax=Planomonospora corallina TaxID=1806052 RepID=A0ABV8IIG8_9ACTN